jgi:hypothetical protein
VGGDRVTTCSSLYGFSSYCRLEAGHEGLHTNTVIEWDDAQAAESTAAIFKAMKGRTE